MKFYIVECALTVVKGLLGQNSEQKIALVLSFVRGPFLRLKSSVEEVSKTLILIGRDKKTLIDVLTHGESSLNFEKS